MYTKSYFVTLIIIKIKHKLRGWGETVWIRILNENNTKTCMQYFVFYGF